MQIKALILASILFAASAFADDQTILPGTMYFESQGDLNIWQYVAESSNWRSVRNYQDVILREREAWKLTNPMQVMVVTQYPELHQSEVKMLSCGRLYKSIFWIDDRDLVPAR
jgi:hypothetical protein